MMKSFTKARKTALGYFKNHIEVNAFVHLLGGIGLGILVASPFANPHPVRWALIFLALSLLGHLYALAAKK